MSRGSSAGQVKTSASRFCISVPPWSVCAGQRTSAAP